ncbi:MAG TPA: undecaprenyldiphospho-muramoylpentapeptide beta-N-acetylglucosaminyltransferase [Chitinophagaceae bacterium]|nr:undecaprenyldiphospho-muramoylpentapeptide beta-N-acetylglucosaminyltransferase [Chitinophagaceae bacterium]
MANKRIIIAGGGTGGHIFPAIAIANALKKIDPSIEILFVGAKGKMEMEKIPQAGYNIKGLDIAGFNRSSLIKNISLPFKLMKSFFQVRTIVNAFKPDAVIGVGGYSSFPVLKYAQVKGIPTFIHESNSFAGKANVMLGKKATKVFVATDGMEKFFPADKIMITGNPVRSSIAGSKITREEGIKFFGLDPNKRTVLVTGGSLGAKGINEAIDAGIHAFGNDVQLIWQTGKPYAERAAAITKSRSGIWTNAFITEMEKAYAAADVVISRAGAMAIAELCVVKKPVIFVPYPFAAEDHQTVNAAGLQAKHAGVMIKDTEAKEKLVQIAISLARDENRQQELKTNIGKLAIADADNRVAQEIIRIINNQ